jgi:Coenzyme PQQ synthesis protein D (PqqD)
LLFHQVFVTLPANAHGEKMFAIIVMERQYRSLEGRQMFTVTPNLRSIVDHDGAVILDIPGNAMITLNATGGYIWKLLERGLQIDEIAAEMARETGVDEAIAARDIYEFMEQLKARQLVVMNPDKATGKDL